MRSPKEWFSLGPYDEDEGRKYHWYNKGCEWNGTRVRFLFGDLLAESENDVGGYEGPLFEVTLKLCQEGVSEFYLPDNESAVYDIHYLSVVLWRWGFYLSIRGRVRA